MFSLVFSCALVSAISLRFGFCDFPALWFLRFPALWFLRFSCALVSAIFLRFGFCDFPALWFLRFSCDFLGYFPIYSIQNLLKL